MNPILIIVLISSIFLRFSNIHNQINFDGEVGLNYLDIKNYIESSKLPLIGPPTGHKWISLGPLFYWLMIPINKIFGFDPMVTYLMFAGLGVVTILLVYFVVSKLIDKNTALIATILMGLSQYWLIFFRYARFYLFAIPLTFIFLFFYIKGLNGNKKYLYISFFVLGIIFNFHLSSIALIFASVVTIFIFKREYLNFKNILYLVLSFSLANIPFVIVNIQSNFEPILKLLLWIPYRFFKLFI